MKILRIAFLIVFLLVINNPSSAETLSGKVVSVADGDTITVLQNKQQHKIRLYGVDCPESAQAFGNKAKKFTSDMVFGKDVKVFVYDVDRYQRSVGVVRIGGTTLNESLLKNGYAWFYTKYCKESFCSQWENQQQLAQEKQIGLWADKNQVPPWDYRKNKRDGIQSKGLAWNFSEESSGGQFHGNTKSHVFHAQSCKDYNCQNCTETFGSVSEAVKDGYRKHEQCVGR